VLYPSVYYFCLDSLFINCKLSWWNVALCSLLIYHLSLTHSYTHEDTSIYKYSQIHTHTIGHTHKHTHTIGHTQIRTHTITNTYHVLSVPFHIFADIPDPFGKLVFAGIKHNVGWSIIHQFSMSRNINTIKCHYTILLSTTRNVTGMQFYPIINMITSHRPYDESDQAVVYTIDRLYREIESIYCIDYRLVTIDRLYREIVRYLVL